MRVEEHDYVRLKNGQTGTVVHVFHPPGTAYEVELSRREGEMVTVREEDLLAVEWSLRGDAVLAPGSVA